MTMRATFYDANGNEVETVSGSALSVAAQCARFILLHGSDPDEEGAAASAGRVEFEPIR